MVSTRTRSARRARPGGGKRRQPLIWREALWGLDWLTLRVSPVYFGVGVPRGDGRPVVLVPGFLTTDAYLAELYFWLHRIGYRPYFSGIGMVADCMQALTDRLEATVVEAHEETGEAVGLIGHSLGGLIARRVALRRPDIVRQLISLGSPIQSLEAHPAIMAAARFMTEHVQHGDAAYETRGGPDVEPEERCECAADHCVPTPPPAVRRAALYTRSDGLVPWRNCREPEPGLNYEVGGSHIGLAFNPRAYRTIAEVLAAWVAAGAGLRAA